MADITLNKITSAYNLAKINDNFDKIQDTLNTDRMALTDNGNTMDQDLDMNGYRVLNTILSQDFAPVEPNDLVRLVDLDNEAVIRSGADNDLQIQINQITASQSSGVIGYATLTTLQADTSKPVGTIGQVTNDPTPTNNTTYRWSGSTWVQSFDRVSLEISDRTTADTTIVNNLAANTGSGLVGFKQNGTGSVNRTVQAKLREVLSPTDFGADPTGVADSSAAFAAFFTQLQQTGAQGQMPAGTFNLNQSYTLTTPVTLYGTKQTFLKMTGQLSAPLITITNAGAQSCHLENFTITGVAQASTSAHGIQVNGGTGFTLKDINIASTYHGIYIPNSQSGSTVKDCFVHNTIKDGFNIDGANLVVDGCYAINCGGAGFNFTSITAGSAGLVLSNSTAYNSGASGFNFQGNGTFGLTDLFIHNCVNSVSPNGHGFNFDTFGKNIIVDNCFSEEAGLNSSLTAVSASSGFNFSVNNHRVSFCNNQATFSSVHGAVFNCSFFSVTGGDFVGNNISLTASGSGILVGASFAVTDFNIVGVNTVHQNVTDVFNQRYGICIFTSGCSRGALVGCNVEGTTAAILINNSATVRATNCPGWASETWGNSTMASGANSVTVTHGLGVAPTMMVATPNNANISPNAFWVGNATATTFTINMSANAGAATGFNWYARV